MTAIAETQKKLLVNERLAAIGEVVTGLAHESRNALQRSHACLAELALDLENMPRSLTLVNKVQKALDDLHLLFEQVRDYSAPIILERRPCSPLLLVKETWQQILDARPIETPPEISINSEADLPDDCMLDNDRIRQVIRNLLENALFACGSPGHITVKLELTRGPQAAIRMEIADDGKGVDPQNRESIFAPFFTTKARGTGLGLAVSKRLRGSPPRAHLVGCRSATRSGICGPIALRTPIGRDWPDRGVRIRAGNRESANSCGIRVLARRLQMVLPEFIQGETRYDNSTYPVPDGFFGYR